MTVVQLQSSGPSLTSLPLFGSASANVNVGVGLTGFFLLGIRPQFVIGSLLCSDLVILYELSNVELKLWKM